MRPTDYIDDHLNKVENAESMICECGKIADSFACKVRHVQLNTGAAKAAND